MTPTWRRPQGVALMVVLASLVVPVTVVADAAPAGAATPTVSLPSKTINQVEGNSGTTSVTLTASLSEASTSTVTVAYATADGTAKSADADYVSKSGTLSFPPGVTSQPIAVAVNGDTKIEDYELFSVVLSAPTNAVLGRTTEKVQILNDDRPELSMADVNVTEGQAANFSLRLLVRYYQPITLTAQTVDGTAIAPGDYTAVSKSILLAAGTKPTLAVTVPTVADDVPEPGETFTLDVSSADIAATVRRTATITWNLQSFSFPIRGIFYYGWFPGTWSVGTNYHPTLGQYSSADPNVIQQHITWMQQANLQVAIASWWGPGHTTDTSLTSELAGAAGTNFQWSVYYEAEGYSAPKSTKIGTDLAALWQRAQSPNWLHVQGKPVIFVYGSAGDACGTVTRWKNAPGRANWFVVMKVFGGFAACANQPDDWHQYAPANATQDHLPYSYVISPGFWKFGETPRLDRDPVRWGQNVHDMLASGARWQLVTTFNEWGEGTGVEPTTEFGTSYLDTLANGG